ncbi:MAG: hypothetical protein N4A71_08100 [Carboxylicivirga sp.]|jgi:hypothetical protein|nr:hypothetical protein [Carboxylicivirga sp.]
MEAISCFNKINFWEYAYSNLIDNRNRAALAEYIVAEAMQATNTPETSWESYDILSPEGIKIEVKCSGFVQSWKQNKLSSPSFDIKKKYGWKGDTNEWDGILDRQADVYVFCLHTETDKDNLKPLASDSWRFYVVATSVINEKLPEHKSVGISTIESTLKVNRIKYEDLKQEILNAYNQKDKVS